MTLRASKAGPPGVTLRPQEVRQAYPNGVMALNFVVADRYGCLPVPVPVTLTVAMEKLRRAVDAEPLGVEAAREITAV
ncbi:hypothetical protein ABZ958_31880 [Streptomyces sp. NPDC046237]|uniref:hypothetical protein n=1 Tax=Streptomyces sp. NPDC046237 TaxID=3154914 RepID=UPI0034052C89